MELSINGSTMNGRMAPYQNVSDLPDRNVTKPALCSSNRGNLGVAEV